jgi:hypothetical protein
MHVFFWISPKVHPTTYFYHNPKNGLCLDSCQLFPHVDATSLIVFLTNVVQIMVKQILKPKFWLSKYFVGQTLARNQTHLRLVMRLFVKSLKFSPNSPTRGWCCSGTSRSEVRAHVRVYRPGLGHSFHQRGSALGVFEEMPHPKTSAIITGPQHTGNKSLW